MAVWQEQMFSHNEHALVGLFIHQKSKGLTSVFEKQKKKKKKIQGKINELPPVGLFHAEKDNYVLYSIIYSTFTYNIYRYHIKASTVRTPKCIKKTGNQVACLCSCQSEKYKNEKTKQTNKKKPNKFCISFYSAKGHKILLTNCILLAKNTHILSLYLWNRMITSEDRKPERLTQTYTDFTVGGSPVSRCNRFGY